MAEDTGCNSCGPHCFCGPHPQMRPESGLVGGYVGFRALRPLFSAKAQSISRNCHAHCTAGGSFRQTSLTVDTNLNTESLDVPEFLISPAADSGLKGLGRRWAIQNTRHCLNAPCTLHNQRPSLTALCFHCLKRCKSSVLWYKYSVPIKVQFDPVKIQCSLVAVCAWGCVPMGLLAVSRLMQNRIWLRTARAGSLVQLCTAGLNACVRLEPQTCTDGSWAVVSFACPSMSSVSYC